MAITIAAETVSGFWQWGGTTAILRIFSTDGGGEWRSVSGIPVPVGSPLDGKFYKDVAITVSGTNISIASCTLEPTEGFLVGYDPTYSVYYYDSTGTIQYGCKTTQPDIRIGQTPSSTTWADIEVFNGAGISQLNQTGYTKAESDYRYATVLGLTPGYLPVVAAGDPHQLADSIVSELDDRDRGILVAGDGIVFGAVDPVHARIQQTGQYLDARLGDDSDTSWFRSGNITQVYGLLGNAVVQTTSDQPQTICSVKTYDTIAMLVILYAATTDQSANMAAIDIGSGPITSWSAGTYGVNDLVLDTRLKVGYLYPDQGARIIEAGLELLLQFSIAALGPGAIRVVTFGVALDLP